MPLPIAKPSLSRLHGLYVAFREALQGLNG